MTKILRNIILIILCMSLLTACNSKDDNTANKDVAMGRYIETNIEFPDNIARYGISLLKKDGNIELFAQEKGKQTNMIKHYKLKDKKIWEEQPTVWLDNFFANRNVIDINDFAYDKNGRLYIAYSNDLCKTLLAVVNNDNTIEEVPLEWNVEENKIPYCTIKILPNNEFLMQNNSNRTIKRFDSSGKFIMDYELDYGDFDTFENKYIISYSTSDGTIKIYDIDSGKINRTIDYKKIDYGVTVFVDDKNSIYVSDTNGINRIALEGSLWETIVEGNMTSFAIPSLSLHHTMADDNEGFISLFYDKTLGTISKYYSYSKDTSTYPTNEITAYMLKDNETMCQVMGEYQKDHYDTKITLNVGITEQSSATTSDVIRALNTEFLAGRGPDLIILDGLPIKSYIEKGVLLNISEVINLQELNSAIANSYSYNDKLYAIPLKFKVPLMFSSNDILNSVNNLEDLIKWGNANSDKILFKNATEADLIEQFYITSAPSWLEDTQINQEIFINFLKSIKALKALSHSTEETEEFSMFYPDSTNFERKNDVLNYAFDNMFLYLQTLKSFEDLSLPVEALKQKENNSFSLAVGQTKGIYEPSIVMSINKNSRQLEIAKEILKFALSEKIQNVDLFDGLPINNNSFEKNLKDRNNHTKYGLGNADTGRVLMAEFPDEKYMKQLATLCEQLTVPSTMDEVLLKLIIEETKDYFSDEKTAEETAEAVAKRTQTYFAE